MTVGKAAHSLYEERHDAHEDESDEQEEEELGQILLDKVKRILVPAAKDVGEVQIILRKRVWKAHYGYVSVPVFGS